MAITHRATVAGTATVSTPLSRIGGCRVVGRWSQWVPSGSGWNCRAKKAGDVRPQGGSSYRAEGKTNGRNRNAAQVPRGCIQPKAVR